MKITSSARRWYSHIHQNNIMLMNRRTLIVININNQSDREYTETDISFPAVDNYQNDCECTEALLEKFL